MTITEATMKRLVKKMRRRGPREQIRLVYKTVPIRRVGSKTIVYKTKAVMNIPTL